MITIDLLEKKHVPYVAQLEADCFSDNWSEASIEAELKNACSRFLVALEAGEVIGYLSASFVADEGAVNRVAVAKDYRRQGVGAGLMKHLLEAAWSQNLAFVTLEVREGNGPAIGFYEAFGFRPVGVRKNFYRRPAENALLMTVSGGDTK